MSVYIGLALLLFLAYLGPKLLESETKRLDRARRAHALRDFLEKKQP